MKEYFNFSKKDRNAILLLLLLILVFTIIKIFLLDFLFQKKSTVENISIKENPKSAIEIKNDSSENNFDNFENSTDINYSTVQSISIHAPFDPNDFSYDDWKNAGFPNKFCKTISHYQQKGGHFKTADDLKKVWGMKDEWFEKIAPFIQIKQEEKKYLTNTFVKKQKREIIVEINTADSLLFDSLPFIGMKTANRIIKYRNLLGGFYSANQLKEVWGFRDSMLLMNEKRLLVDESKIKKIKINSASIDELKKHPYIHYNKANVLVNFRKAHGKFSKAEDLSVIKIFSAEEIEKLSHYLSFE
jgi:competence protein ComEA